MIETKPLATFLAIEVLNQALAASRLDLLAKRDTFQCQQDLLAVHSHQKNVFRCSNPLEFVVHLLIQVELTFRHKKAIASMLDSMKASDMGWEVFMAVIVK